MASASGASGGSSSNAGRLQAQALSAAYAEGESLAGKRRAVAADELDSDLLELLSSR